MIMPIISVRDVKASSAYYCDLLGFENSMTMEDPDGTPNFAVIHLGEAHFGLSRQPETAKGGEGVVFMVYVSDSTDIDAYYENAKAKGLNITEEIKTEYWGDRVFAAKDVDGYVLNFCKTVKQMTGDEIKAAGAVS